MRCEVVLCCWAWERDGSASPCFATHHEARGREGRGAALRGPQRWPLSRSQAPAATSHYFISKSLQSDRNNRSRSLRHHMTGVFVVSFFAVGLSHRVRLVHATPCSAGARYGPRPEHVGTLRARQSAATTLPSRTAQHAACWPYAPSAAPTAWPRRCHLPRGTTRQGATRRDATWRASALLSPCALRQSNLGSAA